MKTLLLASTSMIAAQAFNNKTSAAVDPMMKRSKDSAAMVEYWDLTDTIVDGINALRLAGDPYLPKFVEEDQKRYDFRLRMTKMTNIYRDSVEGLSAKPFERDITLISDDDEQVIPDKITHFIEDVDGSGNNISVFSSQTFFSGVNSAISWIFVDYSKADENIVTQADQKAAGLRPFWSHVLGRNVLHPKSEVINGQEVLTYIKIYEPGETDHIREFERVVDDNGAVSVVWRLYQKSAKIDPTTQSSFVLIDSGTLTIPVIPLVPFITGRRDGRSWRFFPVMRDAADLQIELYQQESALKFVKVLAAYPMLSGNGVKPEKDNDGKVKKLMVGPGIVLYAPVDANGNVGSWSYVEPSSETLKFLAEDVKETQQQLRELARQPLTAQSDNLTVVTASTAAGKSGSAVRTWAMGLKDALENALLITCMWLNVSKDQYNPTVSVYTDFDEFLEGSDVDALQSARDNGDISQKTYWEEMQRRKILGPSFTPEREEKRLMKELPGDGDDNNDLDNPPEE